MMFLQFLPSTNLFINSEMCIKRKLNNNLKHYEKPSRNSLVNPGKVRNHTMYIYIDMYVCMYVCLYVW